MIETAETVGRRNQTGEQMRKVPVIAVVRFSYLFLFREFPTIVRLTWFPLLIAAVVTAVLEYRSIEKKVVAGDFTDQFDPGGLLAAALGIIMYSIVAVALHRVILFNDRQPGRYFVGMRKTNRAERLFIGFGAIFFFAVVAMTVGGSVFAHQLLNSPGLIVLGALIPLAAVIYLMVRLIPLYPVMVVEERMDFSQAFALSRGNFWRLFAVILSEIIPFALILGALSFFYASNSVESAIEAVRASDDPMRTLGDIHHQLNIMTSLVSYALSIVSTGIGIPLICYSYKALRNIGPFEYLDEHGAVINPGGTAP